MEQPERYVSRRVEVDAIQWTGDNEQAVQAFAPDRFYALDDNGRCEMCDVSDPDATAQVWDYLHSVWIPVMTGQWIIRGTKGEYYPCDPEVFAEKYDPLNGC